MQLFKIKLQKISRFEKIVSTFIRICIKSLKCSFTYFRNNSILQKGRNNSLSHYQERGGEGREREGGRELNISFFSIAQCFMRYYCFRIKGHKQLDGRNEDISDTNLW